MSDRDPITDYLDAFLRQSPRYSLCARRVLREVEDHLRTRAEQFCREGIDPQEAALLSVQRFGTPAEVLRRFDREAPIESEVWKMMRYLLTPIVALTILYAGLMLLFSWWNLDGPWLIIAAKSIVAAGVIGFGLLLLRELWKAGAMSGWAVWWVFGGGLSLIAVGSANLVWAAHLGQMTGDWEYYGFVGGGLLVLEGVLAAVQSKLTESHGPGLTA
jgi:hypothetical protein